jgi:glycosyltransferase 2 family protein
VPDGTPGLRVLRGAGVVVLVVFVALLVFLVVAHRNRALAVRITQRMLGPVSPRLAERAAGMMDAFIHGLRLVPSRRKVLLFFVLTAAYWGLNGFGMKLLATGFGFDLSPVQAYTLLGVLVVGVMIPAGPGMVGTFQGAVVLGLSLFADREAVATRGTAYANVLWAVQLAQVVALGVPFLFSRHVQLGRLFRAPGEVEHELEEEQQEYVAAEGGAPAGMPRRGGSSKAAI